MIESKKVITGLTRDELESFSVSLGEVAYRGRQLYDWVYRKGIRSFSEMTDLPQKFREILQISAEILNLDIAKHTGPTVDKTEKFLFNLQDNLKVETVYLPNSPGETVCVSSQVGCALGCQFCATGKMGLFRNLTAGEIVGQIQGIERACSTKLTNVVFMGMGEPLHNYSEVIKAVKLLTDSNGMGLSAKRITVSTVGLVPMIEKWCDDNPPAKLAISLHATTDERRVRLMPINKAYPLEILFKAIRKLAHITSYPVTFEYIMIADFNDRAEDASNLKRLLKNIPAKMNLIRLHPTGSGLKPSTEQAIDKFMGYLVEEGIDCTLRESRGVTDNAACGMLFAEEPFKPSKVKAWERPKP